MTYFLDTNTCIYLLKGTYPALADKLRVQRPSSIKIPAMVQAELYAGATESSDPARVKSAMDLFLAPFEICEFDSKAALVFGEVRAKLSRASVKVGPYDLIIAATVIAHEGILVTNNSKEFSRIEGLRIENWTSG